MTDRPLPPAGPFAADDGSVDPAVAAAMAAWSGGEAGVEVVRSVQQALVGSRVLVPVVATPGEAEPGPIGRGVGRTAHLASVTVTGHDGRRALPVFTSLGALAAWDPGARPVPASAVDAARGAYADGAPALLVDPAPSGVLVIEGAALLALAEGRPWLAPAQDPELLAAVAAALEGVDGLAAFSVAPGDAADLVVTLRTEPARGPEVARMVAERLAGLDLLHARLENGVDVAVEPAVAGHPEVSSPGR